MKFKIPDRKEKFKIYHKILSNICDQVIWTNAISVNDLYLYKLQKISINFRAHSHGHGGTRYVR